ncbi:hypothetical protein N2152v2_004828 [Parachlorella kessleri]
MGSKKKRNKVCQPGDAPVELCADVRVGGPLLLEPLVAEVEVPRASGQAEVTLTIASSPTACSTTVSFGGTGQPNFSVHLSDDPAAPQLLLFGLPWQQAVVEIVESVAHNSSAAPAVIVVCGSKKAGKSTFCRQLVNSLLNHHPTVAFMDTDCGQAEFTPPGLVSLSMLTQPVLGPPHMHLHRPAISYFVGDLSPESDPLRYLRCIREMYRGYQHAASATAAAAVQQQLTTHDVTSTPQAATGQLPPLVVNTHGWVKGLGLDVLIELLQSLHPVSHFVQLCSPNPHKNLPGGVFWAPAGAPAVPDVLMWQLPALRGAGAEAPQPSLSGMSQGVSQPSAQNAAAAMPAGADDGGGRGAGRALAPVESRALQWLAWARQCVATMRVSRNVSAGTPQQEEQQQQEAGQIAATAVAAAGAELADGLAALLPFVVSMDDVCVEVLHGSVLPSQLPRALNGALVGLCSAPAQHASEDPAGQPPPCLGLGFVRAVDARKRLLYVLTDLQEEELEQVATLQLGKLELPSSLLQSSAYQSPYLSLFSLTTSGTGAGVIRSRNNLARQSQL